MGAERTYRVVCDACSETVTGAEASASRAGARRAAERSGARPWPPSSPQRWMCACCADAGAWVQDPSGAWTALDVRAASWPLAPGAVVRVFGPGGVADALSLVPAEAMPVAAREACLGASVSIHFRYGELTILGVRVLHRKRRIFQERLLKAGFRPRACRGNGGTWYAFEFGPTGPRPDLDANAALVRRAATVRERRHEGSR